MSSSLAQMVLQFQEELKQRKPDPEAEHVQHLEEIRQLARDAIAAYSFYKQAEELWRQTALKVLTKAYEYGVQKIDVDGRPVTFRPPVKEEVDPELAEILRAKLSPEQWAECFDVKIVPKKRGLTRFVKMGGPIAELIESHIRKIPADPVPSLLEIGKLAS